jgi:hypothetical protein
MFPIRTKNRKAISVVMTTLIILVASVVLGTGVVLYGTSLFQTGGQTQSIQAQGVKLWVNATYTGGSVNNPSGPISWGAAAIRNNGDVLATVNTLQIRGVTIPFTNWYVDSNQTQVTSGSNFQAQFNYTKNDQNGNLIGTKTNGGRVNGGNSVSCVQTPRNTTPFLTIVMQTDSAAQNLPLCLQQATGPVTLNPGQQMIVFYKMPYSLLSPVDSGSAVTVGIFAGNVGGPTTVTVGNP